MVAGRAEPFVVGHGHGVAPYQRRVDQRRLGRAAVVETGGGGAFVAHADRPGGVGDRGRGPVLPSSGTTTVPETVFSSPVAVVDV
jgi:hypothetical protein